MPRLSYLSLRNRRGRAYLLLLIALGSLGWGIYTLIQATRPTAVAKVRLGGGAVTERRFQRAHYLADEATSDKVQISLVPTKGFDDSIARLASGELDAAIVSLGIHPRSSDNIRVMAGLDVAPLHILARRSITESSDSFTEILKDRRINLGEAGTNDHALGAEVLRFLRLTGQYTEMSLSKDELSRRAEEVIAANDSKRTALVEALPDVVLLVTSMPSTVVQRLLDTTEYDLVPFPYTQNFLLSDTRDRNEEVARRFVEPIRIPAGMYIGATPLPIHECPSLGLRSLLVARTDLSSTAADRFMRAVFESSFAHRINPQSPTKVVNTHMVHDAASSYLAAREPLFTGNFFEQFSDGLSIFGAFIAGALSLYSYLRRRRIRSPGEYLTEIRAVDSLARGRMQSQEHKTPSAITQELDERLVKLKEQLIEDYCNNQVQGELVLMSILSLLSDSRAQIQHAASRRHEQFGSKRAAPDRVRRAA